MRRPETSSEALKKCISDALLNPQQDIDFKKIQALVRQSQDDTGQARKLINTTKPTEPGWSTIYKLYYDVLHALVEGFLLFDQVKSSNHWCLFAYLCEKHSELDFDWKFFEEVRTKRNGIQYYGTSITYNDWKKIELQINLYITTMKRAVEEKLSKTK